MRSSFCAYIGTLAVFTHGEICLSFSQIRSDEVRVALDGFVAVLNGGRKLKKLDETGGAV
jgi:hypothetical protein